MRDAQSHSGGYKDSGTKDIYYDEGFEELRGNFKYTKKEDGLWDAYLKIASKGDIECNTFKKSGGYRFICSGNEISGDRFKTKNGKNLYVRMKNFDKYWVCGKNQPGQPKGELIVYEVMSWEGPLVDEYGKKIDYLYWIQYVGTSYDVREVEF